MESSEQIERRCPRCGKVLPNDAPEGLCAGCLLAAGAETVTATTLGDSATAGPGGPRLSAGEILGPYRIGRLLGRGGMGEVYESEHLESGRRIALKVLRDRLQSTDQRGRFLREGQLAAAISHPHSVYIFGSEEISGTPVISMELLPGGTLKDRIVAHGPMRSGEAVSAILDIVAGLDAAQAAGVLHRDIKPSNCFVDSEGTVKVGDFGLSISTLARDVEFPASGFAGTPQFASPEQLRGEPLDVRSDIYAVGATLYYLLTGKAPFESNNLQELIKRVTGEPARSPRDLRPEIPSGLAAVVLRCLEKSPQQRPASYAALTDALRPFSTRDSVPARVAPRLFAGILDNAIPGLMAGLLLLAYWAATGSIPGLSTSSSGSSGRSGLELMMTGEWNLVTIPAVLYWMGFLPTVYFLVFECLLGTTPGKWLLGLQVTSPEGPATWIRLASRAVAYNAPPLAVTLAYYRYGNMMNPLWSLLSLAVIVALFATARRHNGWAGIHDLVSNTRVVSSTPLRQRRAAKASDAAASVPVPTGQQIGPFAVLADRGETIVGFDPVLRRRVWIRNVPSGTPAIEAARRDVGRATRLFWLMGRRSPSENWDAFEAPDGSAFLTRRNSTISWPDLKSWLLDLVKELQSSMADGSLPSLALDRVWIRDDQRLVLLDFPAPEVSTSKEEDTGVYPTPVALLTVFASAALAAVESQTPILPLSGYTALRRLASTFSGTLEEANKLLVGVTQPQDRVIPWRRTVPMVVAAAPIAVWLMGTLLIAPMMEKVFKQDGEMFAILVLLSEPKLPSSNRLSIPEIHKAFEVYLAGKYGKTLADSATGRNILAVDIAYQPYIKNLLQRYPSVSPQELEEATAVVRKEELLGNWEQQGDDFDFRTFLLHFTVWFSIAFVSFLSLLSALVMPGGILMRFVGLAVVTKNGRRVPRWRSVLRAFVAWSPGIAWLFLLPLSASPSLPGSLLSPQPPTAVLVALLVVLLLGAIWALAVPSRGFHDRLIGTWIVPR